ncbi:MAG: hypothetical protein U1F00_02670 [Rhodoferax sp.]
MAGSKLSNASSSPADGPDQPLGLTVHSLPDAAHATDEVADPVRRAAGRWKMFLVLAVCAAPVIASYFTYYVIRPESRRVFGELIDPQRPLPDLAATPLEGAPSNLRKLRGQWLLLSVSGGACDTSCQQNLYLQRQLREGLGREKDRVDRVWLVQDAVDVPAALRPAVKDATVLRVDPAGLAQWLAPAPGHALQDHLYLVDPLGNWMMRFPAGLDAAGAARAKRDIERVLRATSSWDTAGRQSQP